ncbi:zinc-binding alcohol dehydrogenase [Ancylobacter dichloromethanicus]|uniref:Dehydrogenase n=1 Tax=Ancylobacter dichloromethanicus TaxID=518825 RepID=A0A9W6MZW4_9HYPH|nr:zinc-binding alcohol dehydrogenase [Ancylobacter dichloromethanicus]MBS7555902.1 zinc-binding alcohol dehydrogenase [Ancylobacter dichloromethanicus]GLK72445.1 dehydrogenase [Ancylobacter dichloromethanicus]
MTESADTDSRQLWCVAPGCYELRHAPLGGRGPDMLTVRTLASGVSRGTERLVLEGRVPPGEHQRMRAPLQNGDFPFPVQYGYQSVGIVEAGPDGWTGRTVFALHPHQDVYRLPATAALPLPAGLPPTRATLAANMETALNAMWDSGAGPGDRITIVGGGVIGLLLAALAARLPGADVTLVDVNPGRAELARSLGAAFALPDAVGDDADIVFHTSATEAGLKTALAAGGVEARVVEVSWYGDRVPAVPLGESFHSRRLQLIGSQVGSVSATRRPRWPHARRLAKALVLLDDARLDRLVTHVVPFAQAPARLPELLTERADALAILLDYR